MLIFEVLLFIGLSAASFYLGYRYTIDFQNDKKEENYNPVKKYFKAFQGCG